jgi:hypothetical protein
VNSERSQTIRGATAVLAVVCVGFNDAARPRSRIGALAAAKSDFLPLNRSGGGCLVAEPNGRPPWASLAAFGAVLALVVFNDDALGSLPVTCRWRRRPLRPRRGRRARRRGAIQAADS